MDIVLRVRAGRVMPSLDSRQVLVVGVGEGQLTRVRDCVSEYAYLRERGGNARTFYARIEYVLVSGVGDGGESRSLISDRYARAT